MSSRAGIRKSRPGGLRRSEGDTSSLRQPADHVAETEESPPSVAALAADHPSVGSQAALLGHPELATTLRRSLAAQIGALHGNRHLQRVVDTLHVAQRDVTDPDGQPATAPPEGTGVAGGRGRPAFTREQARQTYDRAAQLYEQGLYAQAIILFERLRQDSPTDTSVQHTLLYNLGLCNLRLQRYATAIIYFERYIATPGADLEDGEARLQEAREGAGVTGGRGRPAVSLEQARRTYDRAARLYEQGRYAQAAILFERLRQDSPADESVQHTLLYNLGICNLRLERYATAIIYFERYIATPGADREDGEARLREAREGAGVPVASAPSR